ncbi:MAG: hypothetical protein ACK4RK_04540 [Gemmataceae bacterium]
MHRDQSLSWTRHQGTIFLLSFCGVLLGVTSLSAQQLGAPMPSPRLFQVTPPGGQVGTTVEVTIAGQDLEEAKGLLFSHPAIKAEAVPPPPPPPPDPKKPAPMPPPPVIINKFKVTIPANVPLGLHDVRVVGDLGVSNPRAFVVGDLPEVLETEPNNDPLTNPQKIAVNQTVNGLINNPTDVDYYLFTGQKGQRVIVSCQAISIDSKANPIVELYDMRGRPLAANRNYSDTDAVLDATLPADGDYYVRLTQFTHTTGGNDHPYRLTVSTAPWIDAIFPPVVEPGKPAQLTIYGRNLPNGQADPTAQLNGRPLEKITVTVNVPNDPQALQRLNFNGYVPPVAANLSGFEYRVRNNVGSSNPYLLTYATAPVVLDNGNNDTQDKAQAVTLPCEIAGRIEKKRDLDYYTFTAKQGEQYLIEMFAERIGSPSIMEFSIYNASNNNQLVYESGDNVETLTPFKFYTRTLDPPRYQFNVPADGQYVIVAKSQTSGTQVGPNCTYRLSITPPQPDFQLIAMPQETRVPDANVLGQGGNCYYDVYAWRRDGFNGEITLSVEGLPTGVTCPPQVIGKGIKHGVLVLSAAGNAPDWAGSITIKGTATINGKPVTREARTASVTWPTPGNQPNIVTISRLDRGTYLAVRDKPFFTVTATLEKTEVYQGDKINLNLVLNRIFPEFKAQAQVKPVGANNTDYNLPANLTFNNNNQLLNLNDKATGVITVGPTVMPGTYTIVLEGIGTFPFRRNPKANPVNSSAIYPTNPLTLNVLPRQLATVTTAPTAATVKIGEQTEVLVRVARMYDYDGPFEVELELPPNIKGVSAAKVTIPAGQNEAKFVLKADADAAPGNRPNLVVKATGMYNGKVPTAQEAKITVNVVK